MQCLLVQLHRIRTLNGHLHIVPEQRTALLRGHCDVQQREVCLATFKLCMVIQIDQAGRDAATADQIVELVQSVCVRGVLSTFVIAHHLQTLLVRGGQLTQSADCCGDGIEKLRCVLVSEPAGLTCAQLRLILLVQYG